MKFSKKINNQSGAAMLIAVIFFLFISLSIISGLVSPTVRALQDSNVNLKSKKSYYLAESGSEDAVYRLLNNMAISASEIITIDSSSATTTINSSGSNQKEIISQGDVNSFQRKLNVIMQTGPGVGFNYGIQSGDGGFNLSGGSKVTGNVYSNSNIQASGGVQITGTAIAAGATSYIGEGTGIPYMGTVVVGTAGVGDAWAYKVLGGKVEGNLYCQLPATYPTGSKNNKACNTTHGIPPAVPMPFTQENIDTWKTEGTNGGIITGSTKCHGGYSNGNCIVDWANGTFGPGKITGNLVVTGGGTLTLTGTVYVVGSITVGGGGKIKLPANYNQYSATLISDGNVSLGGGSYTGSGAAGSYLFVVSTSTCPSGAGCNGNNAINVSGGSGTIAVAAQSGTVDLGGGISINAAVGKTISAHNGAKIFYEQGLASPEFVSGSSGGWNVMNWGETN